MDRSSNRLCIGSTTSTNSNRVRVSCNGSGSHRTGPKHCSTQPTHTYKHKYMLNTLTRAYRYIHVYPHAYTYMSIHIHILMHASKHMLYIHTFIYIPIHAYGRMQKKCMAVAMGELGLVSWLEMLLLGC